MTKHKKIILITAITLMIIALLSALLLQHKREQALIEEHVLVEEKIDMERLRELGIDEEVFRRELMVIMELNKINPLFKHIPHISDGFDIYRYSINPETRINTYLIYLKPKLSPGEEGYRDEITSLVERASAWISSKGVDYRDLNIEWTVDDPEIGPHE